MVAGPDRPPGVMEAHMTGCVLIGAMAGVLVCLSKERFPTPGYGNRVIYSMCSELLFQKSKTFWIPRVLALMVGRVLELFKCYRTPEKFPLHWSLLRPSPGSHEAHAIDHNLLSFILFFFVVFWDKPKPILTFLWVLINFSLFHNFHYSYHGWLCFRYYIVDFFYDLF